MSGICIVVVPFLLILMVGVTWFGLVYNRFVGLRQHLQESWAGIDIELKRRYDLVPNLVSTVQGYAAHEKEVFEKVVEARNRAIKAVGRVDQQSVEEQELGSCLNRLLAVAEAYPELKADTQFQALQDELVNTEDRLAAARRFYNGNVRSMNTLRGSFPTSIVANMAGFKSADFFELTSATERENPRISD